MLKEKGREAITQNKSGLNDNQDQSLNDRSLLSLDIEDENQCTILESLPRISTPKPKIAFGLNRKAFSEVERLINNNYYRYDVHVQASEGIYHPWFLVKTSTIAQIEELELQCCVGGAAFVHCARQLIEDSDPNAFAAKHGPDLESITFSLVLVPSYA